MKTYFVLLAAIGLGIAPITASSQQPSAEEAERAVLEATTAAVTSCAIDAYTEHWDQEASIFTVGGDSLRPIAVSAVTPAL
jgi:uncharacterized membrane protein